MKAIIFNIQRLCVHDGPGIRTVLFLKGCNLRCWWCHNPESKKPYPQLLCYPDKCLKCHRCIEVCPGHALTLVSRKIVHHPEKCKRCFACVEACPAEAIAQCGREMTVAEAFAEAVKDKPFYETSGGGVTVSGGEPLLQPGFVAALFAQLRAVSVNTAVETAGAVSWRSIAEILPVTDLFLYDMKSGDRRKLKSATGIELNVVTSNLRRILETGKPVRVRIPMVPGFNTDPKELEQIARVLRDLPGAFSVTLLKYHSLAAGKYRALNETPPPGRIVTKDSEKTFQAGQSFFCRAGFTVI